MMRFDVVSLFPEMFPSRDGVRDHRPRDEARPLVAEPLNPRDETHDRTARSMTGHLAAVPA